MKISKISKTQVTTKFGIKDKWNLQDEMGQWYDSFCGTWNSSWAVGTEITVKPDQLKQREYNGKTYTMIAAPPEARGGMNVEPIMAALREIYTKLNQIEAKIK